MRRMRRENKEKEGEGGRGERRWRIRRKAEIKAKGGREWGEKRPRMRREEAQRGERR